MEDQTMKTNLLIERKELDRPGMKDTSWMRERDYRKKRSMMNYGISEEEQWPGFTHSKIYGYKRIAVMVNGEPKNFTEHKLVWYEHTGEIPERNEHLHHIDGDRRNNTFRNIAKLSGSQHVRYHHRFQTTNIDTLVYFLLDEGYSIPEIKSVIPAMKEDQHFCRSTIEYVTAIRQEEINNLDTTSTELIDVRVAIEKEILNKYRRSCQINHINDTLRHIIDRFFLFFRVDSTINKQDKLLYTNTITGDNQMGEKTNYSFRLKTAELNLLKQLAATQGISVSLLIRDIICEYLDQLQEEN